MKFFGFKNKNSGLRAAVIVLAVLLLGMGLGLTSCKGKGKTSQEEKKAVVYTCPMHHQIRKDKPGDCPICGMTLIPLDQEEETPGMKSSPPSSMGREKKIKYWANPMNPAQHSDKPKKDEMGMDYVPVYEESSIASQKPEGVPGLSQIQLSAYKEQLIDVKYAVVKKEPVVRIIHTSGRFAGGDGDFASQAGDFAAQKISRPSGRYVVADVYALDVPLVRTGQKALVSSLSGSGSPIPARVGAIYPYDGTQSRVTRVRINLSGLFPPEIFANVDIEASTEPRLTVPTGAVMDNGSQKYVFTTTAPGVFTPKAVTVGYRGDEQVEITSGLNEGEKVVDGANFLIDADSKIKTAFTEAR